MCERVLPYPVTQRITPRSEILFFFLDLKIVKLNFLISSSPKYFSNDYPFKTDHDQRMFVTNRHSRVGMFNHEKSSVKFFFLNASLNWRKKTKRKIKEIFFTSWFP